MKTLRVIVDAQTNDEVVLKRDFRANLSPERAIHGIVIINVQAVLERTAVVYPPNAVDDKRVVPLELITVEDEDIAWVPRNPRELAQMRARALGRERGRLVQDEKIDKAA